MKDRSNLALALAVLAIVIIVAGILVGGLVGRTKYLRLNNVVWKNYIKSRSENRRDAPPAKALGLIRRAWTVPEVLSERLFPDRVGVSGWLERCYFGRIETRAIGNCARHEARFAV